MQDPKIEYLSVKADSLVKNSFNPNQVSPENESKIRESIRRNGLFRPIIVREIDTGYEIIGGEHRWEQAVELGYTEIPIANLGRVSDAKAKEISVIDNARYGIDDTLSLAEVLKDIGGSQDLQEFLPYGEADIDAIFSSSDIALDDLGIDEDFENSGDEDDHAPVEKPPKTHTILRFKVPLADAERITALVSRTQNEQGLTEEDGLTNAGDALVHLLNDKMAGETSE
jgi:hypothetical protein